MIMMGPARTEIIIGPLAVVLQPYLNAFRIFINIVYIHPLCYFVQHIVFFVVKYFFPQRHTKYITKVHKGC